MNELNAENAISPSMVSSFVLVDSTLILIKSKSLLPNLSLTESEEGDIKNLEERLRLYELFTKLGLNIKRDFGKRIIFPSLGQKNTNIVFLPDSQISRESMMAFAKNVLGSMPKKTSMPEVEVKKVISIEEMIGNLTERIKSSIKMNFKDIKGTVTNKAEKVNVIVSFLAILELVKQGIVEAMQNAHNEDIIIEKQESTPLPVGNI
jgi:segregation and condensation protein A